MMAAMVFSPGAATSDTGVFRLRHVLRARTGALVWGAVSLWGCGSSKPQTEVPGPSADCPLGQHFDGTYCVVDASSRATLPEETGPAGGASSSTEPRTSGVGGVTPVGGGGSPVGSGGGASDNSLTFAVPVDITMASAAGPWIQIVAATHLPKGASALGAPFAGQFQQGQVLKQRLELAPGRCYTVLAAAPPPVAELRIGFYAVDPDHPETWLRPALVEEQDSGNQAVLGPKERCFRPTADQRDVWLLLFVDQGQGVAAGQVFQK